MALWDLAGKAASVPVHQLLGGQHRNHIPCFVTTGGSTREVMEAVKSQGGVVVGVGEPHPEPPRQTAADGRFS